MRYSTTTVNSIAIGGFDGMHKAHQVLFKALGEKGCVVAIETGYANLTPGTQRQRFCTLPMMFIELDLVRNFDIDGFIAFLKERFPCLEKIVVGYDFRFGKDRAYSGNDLVKRFEGTVEVIDEVRHKSVSIHSNTIRSLLKEGDVKEANQLLGRDYALLGSVQTGQGLGKKEFVPTLNITDCSNLLPKEGVYATFTRCDDEEHFSASVSFIGHRTTTDGSFAIETHILNKEIEKVTKVEICFVDFLRENRRFETFDALKEQIERDRAKALTLTHTFAL